MRHDGEGYTIALKKRHFHRGTAEAFNVFNRVHLNNPVSALNSNNFGLITSAADPRIIQFALKYTF